GRVRRPGGPPLVVPAVDEVAPHLLGAARVAAEGAQAATEKPRTLPGALTLTEGDPRPERHEVLQATRRHGGPARSSGVGRLRARSSVSFASHAPPGAFRTPAGPRGTHVVNVGRARS